jgi:hypothetical protein
MPSLPHCYIIRTQYFGSGVGKSRKATVRKYTSLVIGKGKLLFKNVENKC